MTFVFITGSGRSGTTLMRGLLDGHSELSVYPSEVSSYLELFFDSAGYRQTIGSDQAEGILLKQFLPEESDGRAQIELESRLRLAFCQKERLDPEGLLAALTDAGDLTVVDVTSPNPGGYLDRFEGAKIIHMIRHPLDILNSQFRRRFADPNSFGGAHPGLWPMADAFKKVSRSFTEAARLRGHERVKVVRLEDLQEDPKRVMIEVLAFLGLDLEPANLSQTKGGKDFTGNSTQVRQAGVFKQERDWSCLTDNDLFLASQLPHLREFYDIPTYPARPNRVFPFLKRTFGMTGANRPRLRSIKRALQLIPIGMGHYLQDLAFKTALEREISQG